MKRMMTLALAATLTSVSASDMRSILKEQHKEASKIFQLGDTFSLTEQANEKRLSKMVDLIILETKDYLKYSQTIFSNNFDRWMLEELDGAKYIIEDGLRISLEFKKAYKREAKLSNGEMAKKLYQVSDMYKKIIQHFKYYNSQLEEYLILDKWADEFLDVNKEVLEALA